jgi:hypothetical protein
MTERVVITMTFDLEMNAEDYNPETDYMQVVKCLVEGRNYEYEVTNIDIIGYEGDIEL